MIPGYSRTYIFLIIFTAFLVLQGCAGFQAGYDAPAVNIFSFKALPANGSVPRFEIGLHIVNPNRSPLKLEGVAYTISIRDHKILTGVSNDLPVIDAYGEAKVRLQANVSIFNSLAFFADLARNKTTNGVSYRLDVKLDPGKYHPVIRVSETGTLPFDNF